MKTLIPFVCTFFMCRTMAQNQATIDSVNSVIGPKYTYVTDTSLSYLTGKLIEVDLDGDNKNEILLVATIAGEEESNQKVFVLARKNNGLGIIDSSMELQTYGYPLRINILASTISFSQRFAHGFSKTDYAFNKKQGHFQVSKTSLIYSEKNPVGRGTLHRLTRITMLKPKR